MKFKKNMKNSKKNLLMLLEEILFLKLSGLK